MCPVPAVRVCGRARTRARLSASARTAAWGGARETLRFQPAPPGAGEVRCGPGGPLLVAGTGAPPAFHGPSVRPSGSWSAVRASRVHLLWPHPFPDMPPPWAVARSLHRNSGANGKGWCTPSRPAGTRTLWLWRTPSGSQASGGDGWCSVRPLAWAQPSVVVRQRRSALTVQCVPK